MLQVNFQIQKKYIYIKTVIVYIIYIGKKFLIINQAKC